MKKIQDLVDLMDEELCGAKNYAEKYIECKAINGQYATKYKEMANDELKHAMYVHDIATSTIEEISKVFTPPIEMQTQWDLEHKKFVEKYAWIKQMLTM